MTAARGAELHVVPHGSFARHFDCDVATLPRSIGLFGWSTADGRWYATMPHVGEELWRRRAIPTLRFLEERVRRLAGVETFWFPICLFDGWRERIAWTDRYRWVEPGALDDRDEWVGAPGDLPRLSARRPWVVCYTAQVGDPSAFLLPEAHWLANGYYASMFDEVRRASPPWDARRPRAVFAGADHGSASNLLAPRDDGAHPRGLLARVVRDAGLAVDVTLGGRVGRDAQLGYRWILDVDGMVRTWDAWAWKLASGSVVLSPASPWETLFTQAFSAWEHYVPVANDLVDLGDRLDWCRDHDEACRAIAQRARARALEVYAPARVADDLARRLRERLTA